MNAFILAAGKGSRLVPLTYSTPKPLARVLGVPMVERILAWLTNHQLVAAAINTHHLTACMQRYFSARNRSTPPHITLFHEAQLLGSGGALQHPHGFWEKPFLLWNADILCDLNPQLLLTKAEQHQGCVLAVQPRISQSYLLVDEAGRVCGLRSPKRGREEVVCKPTGTLQPLAYNGIAALHPSLKTSMPKRGTFDLIDALLQAIAQGIPVYGYILPKTTFFGAIDTPQRLKTLEQHLLGRKTLLHRTTPAFWPKNTSGQAVRVAPLKADWLVKR